MLEYTAENTLRIAKRNKNAKRAYLLVNPLQAKHIPVSPSASLNMMRSLGKKLAQKYLDTKLVIGFAETATAIGAAVAECFGSDCVYIHTTREDVPEVNNWLYFLEEHSHAVEQKICGDNIQKWLQKTPQIILVDDELSTGKTLINMVEQLRRQFPELESTQMIAASIMNRLTPGNTQRLADAGIRSEFLVKLPDVEYTELVTSIETVPAEEIVSPKDCPCYQELAVCEPLLNPRLGVNMNRYAGNCKRNSIVVTEQLMEQLHGSKKVLVLGTEECMYPALVIAEELERKGCFESVRCQATTRSPIGVCLDSGYPITNGYRLHSFYDASRETYIYDLERYDAAVVISDAQMLDSCAMNDLAAALEKHDCTKLFIVKGVRHV